MIIKCVGEKSMERSERYMHLELRLFGVFAVIWPLVKFVQFT